MSSPEFDDILNNLKNDLRNLAAEFISESRDELAEEVTSFFESKRDKIESWTQDLARGDMTPGEYTYLVEGLRDMIELHVLKQKGLAQIRIDNFRDKALKLFIDTVFELIPG